MIWKGISYGKLTQLHFIDGNLNAQKYRDEILRPIVVPVIRRHHLMLQHHNAQPHVTRICTQFLEATIVPVLPWPASSPDWSYIEHVWDALDRRVRQCVPVSLNTSNFTQPLKRSGTTLHSPQSIAWSSLCEGDVVCCMRQMEVTPDSDWFSDPRPDFYLRYLWPSDVYQYTQSCEIVRLGPTEFFSI